MRSWKGAAGSQHPTVVAWTLDPPMGSSGWIQSRTQDGHSAGQWGGVQGRPQRRGRAEACRGRALTIPAALARSGLLGAKLPLWLVDTVLGFLLLSPMASMDWLRLRMARCEGGVGVEEAQTLRSPLPPGNLGAQASGPSPPVPLQVTRGSLCLGGHRRGKPTCRLRVVRALALPPACWVMLDQSPHLSEPPRLSHGCCKDCRGCWGKTRACIENPPETSVFCS